MNYYKNKLNFIKVILFIFLMLLTALNVNGQSSNQYIITPISFVHSDNITVNLIASEPVNTSSFASETVITQGFLQPENFIFLAVEKIESSFFRFYPNPVDEGITIEFKKECGWELELSLINYLGQQVRSEVINIDFQNKLYFSLSDLKPGVYLVRIYDIEKERVSSLKLIKQ